MHLLLAPLEMKGVLSAGDVAAVMDAALAEAWPQATREVLPLADGGPGTLSCLESALPSLQRVSARVEDPLGRTVETHWGLLPGEIPTAFIEAAEACGLWRLGAKERDVRNASTFGVGQLILQALAHPVQRIVVGLGGSGTNDGGAGALRALGVRILDATGQELSRGGAALLRAARVDFTGLPARLGEVTWELATDVTAPLLGPRGASHLFGPQKGASTDDVEQLEEGLTRLADLLERELGRPLREMPGVGASGGLGFGLAAVTGVLPQRGLDVLAALIDLDGRIRRADVVLTAEGTFDAQSLLGKGPVRLAERARALGRPTILFAGRIDATATQFHEVVPAPGGAPLTREAASASLRREVTRWAMRSDPR